MQEANTILEKYKKHPFARGLIPFMGAVRTVTDSLGKVFAKMDGKQRWTMCDRVTGEPAIFSHAAIFAESDDQDTGNYVPDGQVAPFGVDLKTVQRRPNMKCLYTYIFDSFNDTSLYEGQWALDDYMRTVPGFNEGGLPRRAYLSGLDPRYRSRFWMQTPMFLRRGNTEARNPAAGHLHPWIVKADMESKGFRANPDRPRIWMKIADNIVPILERTPATLHRGDVVALSFTITYHVTMANWFAQFHPVDIVVVKDGDFDATDYSAPALDLYSRPPPSLETIPEEESAVDEVQHTTTPVTPVGSNPMNQEVGGGKEDGLDGALANDVARRLRETVEVDADGSSEDSDDESSVDDPMDVGRGREKGDEAVSPEEEYEMVTVETVRETRAGVVRAARSGNRRA